MATLMGNKVMVSLGMKPELRAALEAIAERETGGNKTRVIERLVREAAQARGIEVDPSKCGQQRSK